MFWKLAVVVALAVVAAMVPAMSKFWPWVLVIGVIIAFMIEGVRIVPQQSAWVVERLGRFHGTLEPGLNLIIPFLDRVAYVHSLKEVPLDVPEQVCITKDNVQVGIDGILYLQVLDPVRSSYGIADYIFAISQLAQTTLRSEIGKIDLDRTFEERMNINVAIVNELEAAYASLETAVPGVMDTNRTPPTAQFLGTLANQDKNGDDNRRLGFEIHGTIQHDNPDDVDVYSFKADAGTEVWIDVDRTWHALDAVVELEGLDRVALGDVPLEDGPLGHRLPHLGHQ